MQHLSKDFILQLYATSPAPKRDYHGLTITTKEIILNSWDVSHGPHVYPRRKKSDFEDFLDDTLFQGDIRHLFGEFVFDYVLRLTKGERNLQYLPEILVLYIVRRLAKNDILNLRQTSKIFFEIFNTNKIWKCLFEKDSRRPANPTELKQSEIMSWQYMLRRRKLKLSSDKEIFDAFKKGLIKLQDKELLSKIKLKSKPYEPWQRGPNEKLMQDIDKMTFKINTYKSEDSKKIPIKDNQIKNKPLEEREKKSKSVVDITKIKKPPTTPLTRYSSTLTATNKSNISTRKVESAKIIGKTTQKPERTKTVTQKPFPSSASSSHRSKTKQ